MAEGIVHSLLQNILGQSRIKEPAIDLGTEIEGARRELAIAYQHFNQAQTEEMIVSAIYEIKSIECRYDHLLRKLKAETEQEDQPAEKQTV